MPGINTTKLRRSVILALRSLWLHKLRSALSVLGIIIGNVAVITLMAFGEGSMQDALEEIRRQGATNVIIRSVKPPDDSVTGRRSFVAVFGLTDDDLKMMQTYSEVVRIVPMRVFPQELRRSNRMHNGRVVGTTPEYVEVNDLKLAKGRFLTAEDDHNMENVAVLGSGVAEALFPFENPIDQSVRIGQHLYRVVGVCQPRMPTGGTGGSQAAEVYDDDVYIPLQTNYVRFGETVFIRTSGSRSGERVRLSQITLTVSSIDKVRPVGDSIRRRLERDHLKKDFAVTVPLDKLEQAENEKERFTKLLLLIAGISLLVGGIGIMNIMLATVTERTREIGIRRALGAKRRDIIMQFIIEAIVQTILGGAVGVIIGVVSIYIFPLLSRWILNEKLPAQLRYDSIVLSMSFSVAVGVVFGLYPAWKASRLDPIEALRHE